MILLNPARLALRSRDARAREIMSKTVSFFEQRGRRKLKEDDHAHAWYSDFLAFVAKEHVFATLLTPEAQASGLPEARWDSWRICELNEILGFYGLAYWYTWQVSILGLGPIWMSRNEALKHRAAKALRQGGIFAFGLSEKEHGADVYASEMTLTAQAGGDFVANGRKYYIGNANQAALISTFGRLAEGGDYAFFAVDRNQPGFDCVQNVCASQNYVAEFTLRDYAVKEDQLLSRGTAAWDAALNTVNVGKFNLGWAAIGICTHAFYEALNHAAHRRLFGKHVTDFAHIKQYFVDAYTRLVAMKLFSLRAIDYMRVASREDRRYLLYNPMVKMKVTTQGEEVVNLLWDVIAAKGFEKDMVFEMATRDIRALPKLEGTVHVNMALIIKFMANYFLRPAKFAPITKQDAPRNDDFLFDQGPTKGLSKIRFHDYRIAYASVDSPNLRVFKKQIRLLKAMLLLARPSKKQADDFDFLLNLGELFTLVVYGQLIIEARETYGVGHDLLDQIFDVMVRDFSKFALQLHNKPNTTRVQQALLRQMFKRPAADEKRFERVLHEQVYALIDAYQMRDDPAGERPHVETTTRGAAGYDDDDDDDDKPASSVSACG